MQQPRSILLILKRAHPLRFAGCHSTKLKSHILSLVHCQNIHSSQGNRSIFVQNEAKSLNHQSDVPDVGQPMESWHYHVHKDGKLTVRSLMDVHVQPLDPQRHPQMNKLFINILYTGKDRLNSAQLYELTKQYIVNVDLDDNNQGVELTIKQKVSMQLNALCHIQVPIKYDVDLSCFKTSEASLTKMESDNINVRTQQGDCIFNNVKGFNVNARSSDGGILCQKLLQGNLKLITEGRGEISAGRLQGQTIDCQTNDGDIDIKAIYADRSWFHSNTGNISLGSCHGNTQLNIEDGNLKIDTLDGDLTGVVRRGDTQISMPREGNVHLETEQGDIELSVPESIDNSVNLHGNQVDQGKVVVHNKQITHHDNSVLLTGDLKQKSSHQNLINATTKSGQIKLNYYNWLASLNLNKG